MLAFIRALRRDRAFLACGPGLVLAFVTAEMFYKFHSFALECATFLVTWLVADVIFDFLFGARTKPSKASVEPS